MKNRYNILLTLLILLLTPGCGKHYDTVEGGFDSSPKTYIFFDTDVDDTKGNLVERDELPAEAGTAFGVFGFRPSGAVIFDRYKTSASGNDQISSAFENVAKVYRPTGSSSTNVLPFTYDGLAGWFPGKHTFYAYYPYESTPSVLSVVTTGTNAPYVIYTQPTTLGEMVDVMTATSTLAPTSDGVVALNFDHRLFAFDVVFNNNQTDSDREVIIKSAMVQFLGVTDGGVLYFSGGITPNTTKTDLIVTTYATSTNNLTLRPGKHILNGDNSYLFLPCLTLQMKLTMTIENAWGEEITLDPFDFTGDKALAPTGGFQAGRRYAFTINKSDKDIEFVCDLVEDWDPKDVEMEFN